MGEGHPSERAADWENGIAPNARELADLISGFPRIHLCTAVIGAEPRHGDYLLAEADRWLITQALRAYTGPTAAEAQERARSVA